MKKICHKIWLPLRIKLQRYYLFSKYYKLLFSLVAQHKISRSSVHGIKHWLRVKKAGGYLCSHTGADYEVVFLFAYLHDIGRVNEESDPEHGQRAAMLIEGLYRDKQVRISQGQLEALTFACRHHNDPSVKSESITIQTCWDADRLDLWRVGITPDPLLLNNNYSKRSNVIDRFK
jgi:uncharacterized protein